MLMSILYIVLALVGLVLVAGLLLPSATHVERSKVMRAKREDIWPYLTNFRNFNQWSPWFNRDPDADYKFEGPESGVGASMSWQSDKPNVGAGSQKILKAEPHKRVETELDFGAQGTAVAFFTLEEVGEGTKVTWGFDTLHGFNLMSRAFGLMFDKWIGADYEAGLESLRELVESE